MHPFPHHYTVSASAGVEPLRSAPPIEFDGPGDRWSPESLLCGALADCFVLTFRAIARSSSLPWLSLDVEVAGTLERVGRESRFTQFMVTARLRIAVESDRERAERALHKAEAGCLISNSLSGERQLTAVVETIATGA